MKCFMFPSRRMIAMVVVLAFTLVFPPIVFAKSPVKLKKFIGAIDFSAEGPTPFTLEGTGSHLGKYSAYGEVQFVPGEQEGSLVGQGVAVFEAANGDLLVGVVTWEVGAAVEGLAASGIHFSWRDAVEFSDGTVASSTGRFADASGRPPGLVVIAIIAILIGLLLPAVQK